MESVDIVEVGPRDGLQNEAVMLSTAAKVSLISRAVAAGLRRIEVASFVSPKAVPQMADAEEVCAQLPEDDRVSYIGLVLNRRGLERALATTVDEVNFVVGATETFNLENQGAAVDETMSAIEEMVPQARNAGLGTSATISVAFGCPYEGEVDRAQVAGLAHRLAATGIDELALGDTIGVAVPTDVTALLAALTDLPGNPRLRCHFHNTRNTGYSNAYAAVEAGVRVLDASLGGVGGCPFAPNATGNIATEDLVYLMERMGFATGVDLSALTEASTWLGTQLGSPVPALLGKAGPFP